MKLLLHTSPYRLEQGYQLGFGPSVYVTMAEIILTFASPDEDILFSCVNWDKDLATLEDVVITDSVECFQKNFIHDPDNAITQAVQEILLGHYAPGCDPALNQDLMDQLLVQFRETPLDEINEELLIAVGTFVHNQETIYTLEDCDERTQAFVNSRLVATNTVWLLPGERPEHLKNILWFRANSKADILESFELTGWWFQCAVVKTNASVSDYRYFLSYTEEHGEGEEEHDGMVLYITAGAGMEEHFREVVVPRLQHLLGETLELVG